LCVDHDVGWLAAPEKDWFFGCGVSCAIVRRAFRLLASRAMMSSFLTLSSTPCWIDRGDLRELEVLAAARGRLSWLDFAVVSALVAASDMTFLVRVDSRENQF
jgi:hypothetical protein